MGNYYFKGPGVLKYKSGFIEARNPIPEDVEAETIKSWLNRGIIITEKEILESSAPAAPSGKQKDSEMEKAFKKLTDKLEELEKKVSDLREENEILKIDFDKLSESSEKLRKENEALKAKIEILESENNSLKTEISKMQKKGGRK